MKPEEIVRKASEEKLVESSDFRFGWVCALYNMADRLEEYVKKNVEINHKIVQKEMDDMINQADEAKEQSELG